MMSDYFANTMLNAFLRNTPFSLSNTPYLAMYLKVPDRAVDVPTDEVSGGGYVRQLFTCSPTVQQQIRNSSNVYFPAPTATWATETNPIVALAMMEDLSGGKFLFATQLNPRRMLVGDPRAYFPKNSIAVSFLNSGITTSNYLIQSILNTIFRAEAFDLPDTVWVALLKGMPSRGVDSVATWEVDAIDYERVQVTFEVADRGQTKNDVTVVFAEPETNWAEESEPVNCIAIMDAETEGKWLFSVPVPARTLLQGSPGPQFERSEIRLLFDGQDFGGSGIAGSMLL